MVFNSHPRIAFLQHGDYAAARQSVSAGVETYTGQRYTIEVYERCFGHVPHLIVDVEAPPRRIRNGPGEYVGVSHARIPLLPGRLRQRLRAHFIISAMRRFRPDALILRAGEYLGCRVLAWAVAQHMPTAIIIARRLDP